MKKIRFRLFVVVLFGVLLAVPTTAQIAAQTDPLTQNVTSMDSSLTVYYPRDWTAYPRGNGILLGNDMSALNNYATMPLNSGEVVIRIGSPSAITEEHGDTLQAITISLATQEGMIASETVLINGQAAKRITVSDSRVIIVFPVGEAQFSAAQIYTAPGELEAFDALIVPILEAITYTAPTTRPVPRNNLVRGLLPRYEGTADIPVQFDYPTDWFISETPEDGQVYVSNENLDRNGATDAALIIGLSASLDTFRDPAAERDRALRRFWSSGVYGEAQTMDTEVWAGVYAVEYDDRDYDFTFSYLLSGDFYFENGVLFVSVIGFPDRDYEDDQAAIFAVLESARIRD